MTKDPKTGASIGLSGLQPVEVMWRFHAKNQNTGDRPDQNRIDAAIKLAIDGGCGPKEIEVVDEVGEPDFDLRASRNWLSWL